ncbi:MAG: Gfo/Idh/MocA family oxidoreductase [Caldilineaceae bacterium]|nr:Gfo/Idh/MocA family oxidoreductase [Caldilineaceae bacterium]
MNPPFRVLLAGCGGISRAWLSYAATHPDLDFVALVDLLPENARTRQTEYDLDDALIETDLAHALATSAPDIVFNCTIPEAHTEVTLTSLQAGCHVLGEKPLATSMQDAAAMVAAAQSADLIFAVIQNRRYLDGIVRYRDLVRSGQLGPLTTLNADFYIGAHFGGFRDEMAHVLLIDMAIHSFDQARFIADADPVSVYCHEWNPPGSWYAHGASAMAIFEMSNGLLFNYRGSWCAEGLQTAWACDWRAVGQFGSARWDGEDVISGEVVVGDEGFFRPKRPVEAAPHTPLTHTGHAGVIHEFIESIKEGQTPQTICTDNVKSLAMVYAAIESAETGRKVPVRY